MMKDSSSNVEFEGFYVNMMNSDGDFSKNNIKVYYYKEPAFDIESATKFAYSNEEKPLIISTNFFWNDAANDVSSGNNYELFREYSKLSCRFNSTSDSTKSIVTPAVMETKPIGRYKERET